MADTLHDADAGPIIIKKKIRLPEEPHGGAWKVAYADFVTAMMAFFLLLWLLNVTTEDKKQGISNFFEPIGVTANQTGSGGVLKGLAMSVKGALRSAGSPPSVTVTIPTFGSQDQGTSQGKHDNPVARGGGYSMGRDSHQTEDPDEESLKQVAAALRQAIQDVPEIGRMQDSLLVEQTPDGLRIQLLDQTKFRLFGGDDTTLTDRGRHFLAIIGSIIAHLPNKLAITGHTDKMPAQKIARRSGWEISGDRANSARRAMIEFGVTPARIVRVIGKADREPLRPHVKKSPHNHRISVLLLRLKPIRRADAGPPRRQGG